MPEIVVSKYRWENRNMSREDIIRFQLAVHCHLHGIELTKPRLEVLVQLGLWGESDMTEATTRLTDLAIFTHYIGVRNVFNWLAGKKLVVRKGTYRKKIMLNPELRIQTEGNILMEIKCLSRDVTKESN